MESNENSMKNVSTESEDIISVTKEKRGFRFRCTCTDRMLSRTRGSTWRQLTAVSALSIGCVLDGVVLAYSSPALPSMEEVNTMDVLSEEITLIL